MLKEFLFFVTPFIVLGPSLFLLYLIRCLDPIEKEPAKYIYFSVIAGCISTVPVLILYDPIFETLNKFTQDPNILYFADEMYAPISEEISKLIFLAIILLIIRREADSLIDFIVYSSAIAIGFEFVENVLYQLAQLDDSQPFYAWLIEFDGRTISGIGSHLIYSVWNGVAIWTLLSFKAIRSQIISLPLVFVGILLHAINNFSVAMSQYGSPDEILSINHFGNILYSLNAHFGLIGFLGLVGAAVLFDAATLQMLHIEIIDQHGEDMSQSEKDNLCEFSNPFMQCLSNSNLIWRWSKKGRISKAKKNIFKRFAKSALAFGRERYHSKPDQSTINLIVSNARQLLNSAN